jgi:hypothetical protein
MTIMHIVQFITGDLDKLGVIIMNMTKITGTEEDTFSSVIDVSSLTDGDTFEGLAYVQRVENGKTNSERAVARFFLRGKFNLVTQANFYLINRDYFKNEDALRLNKKIVYVKGITEIYDNNHTILSLESIQEFVSDLTPSDFFMKNKQLSEYTKVLEKFITSINTSYRSKSENLLYSSRIIDTLSKYVPDTEGAYVGDELVVLTEVVKDLLKANSSQYHAAFLAILVTTEIIKYRSDNRNSLAKEKSLLEPKTREILNVYNSVEMQRLLETDREREEVLHLLDVIYLGVKPMTFLAKVYTEGTKYYRNYLVDQHLEDTPNIVHHKEHIRLR